MKKIIIDTDPGKDDLFAILYLLLSKRVNVNFITTVAGNSNIQNVTTNARFCLNLASSKLPIYSGAAKPLKSKPQYGTVMGTSGLDGVGKLPPEPLNNQAVDQIISTILENPNQITVLAIGPLTNIALAFKKQPKLPKLVKELVIMGGAIYPPGNSGPFSEFNFNFDPEAADIVFRSNAKKVLIPLDLCYQTTFKFEELEPLENSQLYPTFKSLLLPYQKLLKENEGQNELVIYDLLAAYYLTNPQDFAREPINILIETQGELTRGMSVADLRKPQRVKPNTLLATRVTKNNLIKNFINTIKNY